MLLTGQRFKKISRDPGLGIALGKLQFGNLKAKKHQTSKKFLLNSKCMCIFYWIYTKLTVPEAMNPWGARSVPAGMDGIFQDARLIGSFVLGIAFMHAMEVGG